DLGTALILEARDERVVAARTRALLAARARLTHALRGTGARRATSRRCAADGDAAGPGEASSTVVAVAGDPAVDFLDATELRQRRIDVEAARAVGPAASRHVLWPDLSGDGAERRAPGSDDTRLVERLAPRHETVLRRARCRIDSATAIRRAAAD